MSTAMNKSDEDFERWMKVAVEIAVEGVASGESPFGAVIVDANDKAIACVPNRVNTTHNPTAHAETTAIAEACQKRGTLQLNDCILYATGEPCPMCVAAAAMAGIATIVFGASERVIRLAGYQTFGLTARQFLAATDSGIKIIGPLLEAECTALLLNHPKDSI